MSFDNRRRIGIKFDFLSQTEETLNARVVENNLGETITAKNPTVEDLKELLTISVNKSSTNLAGLERNLVDSFQEKRELENKLKENGNTESTHQALTIFLSNLMEVIDHILSKKKLGEEILKTYQDYEDLVNKACNTSIELELGRLEKTEATNICKEALDVQAVLVIKMNEFYLDNLNEDEELMLAQSALIGAPRNIRDQFRNNIEELKKNNVIVFNTSSNVEIKISNVQHLQEQENHLVEALRACRTFNDEDQNQLVTQNKEKRLMLNMISDLLIDIYHLEREDVDISNVEVMKNSLDNLEKQLISVARMDPEISKAREEIVYEIGGEEIKESHIIGNVIKKIRYEILKKEKALKDIEKEETNKTRNNQSLEKGLPRETIPDLKEEKYALVWMHEVKRLAEKYKDDKSNEGRFTTMIRNSLKIESDKIRAATLIDPFEIVKLIKSKYIDSGQAVKSCLKEILKRNSPRTIEESVSAMELTCSQLKLFNRLGYSQLLSHPLMDNLCTKIFRREDMEAYILALNEYLTSNEENSFITSSPAREVENSVMQIAHDDGDQLKDDLKLRQEFFMQYINKKIVTLKMVQGSYERANLFKKTTEDNKYKFKKSSTSFATIEEESGSESELNCVTQTGRRKDFKKLKQKIVQLIAITKLTMLDL